ncbi:MAG: hypothetical protein EOM29_04255 [Bacteroidia bacterium]|nr:hypothetical protein [Bacteroidia bacterium]
MKSTENNIQNDQYALLIMFHFFNNSASAIQNRRLLEIFIKSGITPTVITGYEIDNKIIESNSLYRNIRFIVVKSVNIRIIKGILRYISPDILNLGDNLIWNNKVYNILKREVFDYQFVYTISYPLNIHMLGVKLKKNFKINLFVHFYDPWVDNFFRKFNFRLFKKLDCKLEKKINDYADKIIHTNDFVYNNWIQRYPDSKDKTFVFPLISSPLKLYNCSSKEKNDKIKVVHAGNIYLERNINFLVQCLIEIRSSRINSLNDIEFHFFGYSSHIQRKLVKDSGLNDVILFSPRISHDAIINEMYNSDYLLIIDSKIDFPSPFFPSKLCDYFESQKPIISIANPESITYKLIEESKNYNLDIFDVEKSVNILFDLMKKQLHFNDKFFYNKFRAESLIHLFQGIIN